MRVISWKRLREFADAHPTSLAPLKAWRKVMESQSYPDPHALKRTFGKRVDFLKNGIVVDIGGNNYRISTNVMFRAQRTYVRRVMTHQEYDDATAAGTL
jgi:mRNA interferase HigB